MSSSMTKKDIINLPNPHLRQKSKKITHIDDVARNLAEDMQQATLDWEASHEHEVGVALAAVQVDHLVRMVVVREDFEDKENKNFKVFINPEIIKYEGEIEEDYEGCLSITGVYGRVPRHNKVRVKATDLEGKEIRLKAKGFMARIFQHEIDHTDGVVFIDHIKDAEDAFFHLEGDGQLTPLDYEKDIRNNRILW